MRNYKSPVLKGELSVIWVYKKIGTLLKAYIEERLDKESTLSADIKPNFRNYYE